jgi:hypothetical protein
MFDRIRAIFAKESGFNAGLLRLIQKAAAKYVRAMASFIIMWALEIL